MNDQSVTALPLFKKKEAASPSIDPEKLLHSIMDVVCVVDEAGIVRYISPSCRQLFGYRPEEVVGQSFLSFLHPEDIEKTVAIISDKTPGSNTSNFENRFFHKNGAVVPVVWSGRWDEADRLLYCVARDGSEKREIEQRLMKAQQMARVANYEYDVTNNVYTYVSDTLFDIFGLDKEKDAPFTTQKFWQLVHPDDLAVVKSTVLQPEHLYSPILEYRIIRPDGQLVYINRMREVIRDGQGKPVKTLGTLQDITDRKLKKLALQQSEERFRTLVQNGNDLIGILDETGRYIFVAPNVSRHLGLSAQELVGKSAFEFIHPDDAPLVARQLAELLGQGSFTLPPFRFSNGQGEWRWMETHITNHLHNPCIAGLVTNSKDITDKKLKEDALSRSEQRFKELVQNGSDLIVIIDEQGTFTYISENVQTFLGYTPGELMGRNVFDFIPSGDAEKVAAEIGKVLRHDDSAEGVQHRFLHKDGSWRWLESKGANHNGNDSIQGILVNARNIDDRVKLQHKLSQELINKQKEITSAVIRAQEAERSQLGLELHDNVNQILTTVKLYTEMYLTGYVQSRELLEKSTGFIQDCINEIRSISKRLSAPTLGKISLKDSIGELVDSINLTRRIEIKFLFRGDETKAVSEDLHLAVYRIVQEGINNVIKYAQANEAVIDIKLDAGSLCLKIFDNGVGFDMNASRAGIGITNMKTRAENLNATFRLLSAPGNGCKIEICFPL